MSKFKVLFLGRFPAYKEVGGVTTFTYNFADTYKGESLCFLDFYPAKQKIIPKHANAVLFNQALPLRILKLFYLMFFHKGSMFFNFSTFNSLLLLAILPKRKGGKWFLILHNGNQAEAYSKFGLIKSLIAKIAIRKIDMWGAISNTQRDFYKSIEIKDIYKVSPFLRPSNVKLDPNHSNPDNNVKSSISKTEELPSFLISGFPTKIYRLIETLEVFRKLHDNGLKFRVNVGLYGFDTDGIQNDIIQLTKDLPFTRLYQHLDAEEFRQVLLSSSIYVRMNTVDSFGLVVGEAIEAGLRVIATDVCERFSGAYLIKPDDFETLYLELQSILGDAEHASILPVQKEDSELTGFEIILSLLQD